MTTTMMVPDLLVEDVPSLIVTNRGYQTDSIDDCMIYDPTDLRYGYSLTNPYFFRHTF